MKSQALFDLLLSTIPARLPILITGAPGIGKTDIVKQAAKAAGARLIISHPVVSDPVDFKGMPTVTNGEAHFLPFGELQELIKADTLTVFFLDDLGQAPASVQAAAMQLILARRINGFKVSDQVCFIAATNRKEDRAGVSGILEPVKSRFAAIVQLDVDLDGWCKWALSAGLPTELVAFIRFRPGLLHDFKPSAGMVNSPCPRTVANVGRLMAVNLPAGLEYEVFSGAAGEGFAAEFVGFLQIFRSLPNPDAVLMDPEHATVPSDPATMYALCGALARKANANNVDRFFSYINRLPVEFQTVATLDAIRRDKDLQNTRPCIDWFSQNSDVLI